MLSPLFIEHLLCHYSLLYDMKPSEPVVLREISDTEVILSIWALYFGMGPN